MTIIKELDALHVNGEEYKFPAGEGDMKYADFSLVEKTGATVTLDLFSYVEPSANFTVNAPSEIKEGQEYILRVENGATAYTMTLGTNITNPYSSSTTLTANGIDQFVFLAVDGKLELQAEVATQSDLNGKQDKATSGSTAPTTTPSYVGQQYVDTTNDKMYIATGTSSSSDWTEVGAGSGDMLYADFNRIEKTGATVTLDLNSYIEPSANFTVNAPSTIEDGQMYILRVVTGATPYTMTLGTGITNPYSESITLVANTVHQFGFLAIDGDLELQPSVTQSGGGEWGTITGTLSNQTDLQTALNAKANASDVNTKTFFLTGTAGQANIDTAQAAYDYYITSGKNPIVIYEDTVYVLDGVYSNRMRFNSTEYWVQQDDTQKSGLKTKYVQFDLNSGTVTGITANILGKGDKFLCTNINYSNPYIPQYDGSPATKKYVDDNVAYVGSSAPSSPSEGRLWYDTTNDVLKSYDGTNWNECGGGVNKSWVTKTISSGEIELGIRTLVNNPSSNFTLTKPATLIDGEEYILRVNNGSTARTITLGTGFTNPHNINLTLSTDATDQLVFLSINNSLELQPLITINY